MKMTQFADLPVIDCHVHFNPDMKKLKKGHAFLDKVARKGRLCGMYLSGNTGIHLKSRKPGFFYVGGGVPWSGRATSETPSWDILLPSFVAQGFDGIGEMGSKTVLRSRHVPLDGEYYAPFWRFCEKNVLPVLCHVADPEEFWDEKLAPQWAKENNWVYYNGDFPSKKELYKETEHVLSRHPRLDVVLAHFYFMSGDLEGSARFLDKYKNAHFDLTLGIELMYNISRRRDDWRKFFIEYQDRIFFGTDIMMWLTIDEALARIWLLRNFLETDEEFFTPPEADRLLTRYKEPYIGLHLPKSVLRKIYAGNFRRVWGRRPKKENK
jgi:predicted TIM-barrel fold metal-dependent hydrolase